MEGIFPTPFLATLHSGKSLKALNVPSFFINLKTNDISYIVLQNTKMSQKKKSERGTLTWADLLHKNPSGAPSSSREDSSSLCESEQHRAFPHPSRALYYTQAIDPKSSQQNCLIAILFKNLNETLYIAVTTLNYEAEPIHMETLKEAPQRRRFQQGFNHL